MPAEAERPVGEAFENYFSTTYSHCNDVSPESLRRRALAYERTLGEFLPHDRAVPILEVGCGVGGFLLCCRQLGYSRVHGIDISAEQIALCRDFGFENVEQAEGLGYLRQIEQRFGAIVCIDVLEHVPRADVLPTLRAAYERLVAGGTLIAQVPNLSNPLNIRTRYVDFTHESGFTRESLAQVLRIAGFDTVTVRSLFSLHRLWPARLVFDHLLWRAFRLVYRHTLHLKNEPSRGKNLLAVGVKAGA